MAESYSEDDDLKRIKDWWVQNGLAVVLGISAGLGVILAWQGWNVYVDNRAREAAGHYVQLRTLLTERSANDRAETLVTTLREEYAATPYAALGSLLIARRLVADERYEDARGHLQWTAAYADQVGLRHLARVRQARLLWAWNKSDEALELLAHNRPEAFASLYGELAGDIHTAAGDLEAARNAYLGAMKHLPAEADPVPLQRKLDNVAVEGDATDGEAA